MCHGGRYELRSDGAHTTKGSCLGLRVGDDRKLFVNPLSLESVGRDNVRNRVSREGREGRRRERICKKEE